MRFSVDVAACHSMFRPRRLVFAQHETAFLIAPIAIITAKHFRGEFAQLGRGSRGDGFARRRGLAWSLTRGSGFHARVELVGATRVWSVRARDRHRVFYGLGVGKWVGGSGRACKLLRGLRRMGCQLQRRGRSAAWSIGSGSATSAGIVYVMVRLMAIIPSCSVGRALARSSAGKFTWCGPCAQQSGPGSLRARWRLRWIVRPAGLLRIRRCQPFLFYFPQPRVNAADLVRHSRGAAGLEKGLQTGVFRSVH